MEEKGEKGVWFLSQPTFKTFSLYYHFCQQASQI